MVSLKERALRVEELISRIVLDLKKSTAAGDEDARLYVDSLEPILVQYSNAIRVEKDRYLAKEILYEIGEIIDRVAMMCSKGERNWCDSGHLNELLDSMTIFSELRYAGQDLM